MRDHLITYLMSSLLGAYLVIHFKTRGFWRCLGLGIAAGLFVWGVRVITVWYSYRVAI